MKKELGSLTLPLTGKASVAFRARGTLDWWYVQDFAQVWYEDAKSQVVQNATKDNIRREIVFSVALAETYLFEWVRDDVLRKDYQKLNRYFARRTSVVERWKSVPRELQRDQLIMSCIDYGRSTAWDTFTTDLVPCRNGLLHAGASRPEGSAVVTDDNKPRPSSSEFSMLQSGWALGTVRTLVFELNAAAGTSPPPWL